MSAKLLAAGAVLTVLAVATEKHIPAASQEDAPVQAGTTTFAVKVVSGVGSAFEQITSSAVRQMIETTEGSLDQIRPVVEATSGARGKHVRRLYATATELTVKAKQEVESGRPFTGLDLALAANGRIGDIKKEFERE